MGFITPLLRCYFPGRHCGILKCEKVVAKVREKKQILKTIKWEKNSPDAPLIICGIFVFSPNFVMLKTFQIVGELASSREK